MRRRPAGPAASAGSGRAARRRGRGRRRALSRDAVAATARLRAGTAVAAQAGSRRLRAAARTPRGAGCDHRRRASTRAAHGGDRRRVRDRPAVTGAAATGAARAPTAAPRRRQPSALEGVRDTRRLRLRARGRRVRPAVARSRRCHRDLVDRAWSTGPGIPHPSFVRPFMCPPRRPLSESRRRK